jgi:hypothetical protein
MARFAPIFDLAGRTQHGVAAYTLRLTALAQTVTTVRTTLYTATADSLAARPTAGRTVFADRAVAPRTVRERILVDYVIAVGTRRSGPPPQRHISARRVISR